MDRLERIKENFEHGDTPSVGTMEWLIKVAEAATKYMDYSSEHHGEVQFEVWEKLRTAIDSTD